MIHTITLSPHELHTLKQALLTAEMHAKKLGAGAARDISALHADIDQQIEHPERFRDQDSPDLTRSPTPKEIIGQIKAIQENYLLTNQTQSA